MKARIFYAFMLLAAITGCSKTLTEPDFTATPNPNSTELDMVFVQGSDSKSLGSFSIGKFVVTQAQWKAVMGTSLKPSSCQTSGIYILCPR